jgi:DNA-binding XRE family transcriptional regulator
MTKQFQEKCEAVFRLELRKNKKIEHVVSDRIMRSAIAIEEAAMPVMTKTPKGEDIVILSLKEYQTLTRGDRDGDGEDSRDAAIAQRALSCLQSGEEETLSSKEVAELLKAKSPLAFWRKKRDLSQNDIAAKVGVAQGYISEIEAGKKTGDVAVLKRIAETLNILVDDLV